MHAPYYRRRLGCLACAVFLGWLAAQARAATEPAGGPPRTFASATKDTP